MAQVEFGFYPNTFNYSGDKIKITTLPDLKHKVDYVASWTSVYNGWIYAPRLELENGGEVTQLPYTNRYFGMPMTHTIEHQDSDPHRLWFLVWVFGFLAGMKMMPEGHLFLDSTPLKSGSLNDFYASNKELKIGLECADALWDKHGANNLGIQNLEGAIHALWLAKRRNLLQFEEFTYAYQALDACWRASAEIKGLSSVNSAHANRLEAMAIHFNIEKPEWLDLPKIRNSLFHEALISDGSRKLPLGYANIPSARNPSIPFSYEMLCFVRRVIVGLLDMPAKKYIQSSMTSMQQQALLD
ncbi:hypothetical protein OVA03_13580 [Asticcacaulis sp. SL142]|uniref:hypothetical protein n=1 Tax=Asticcacaulis sp. SL142 TaxID=2995155 RepID=UPI00226CA114|nr:hypothetical protein [Asticcacaulis sp. SL142]WAC47724.1 hypothetical protein OVA03_13580 [Asticcacaulis sp. SL142]